MGAGALQQFPLFVCTYTQKQTVCRLVARTQRTYVIYRENSWVPSCREERRVQKGEYSTRGKKKGGVDRPWRRLFLVFPSLFRHRHSLRYKFPSGGRRLNVWTLDWRSGRRRRRRRRRRGCNFISRRRDWASSQLQRTIQGAPVLRGIERCIYDTCRTQQDMPAEN